MSLDKTKILIPAQTTFGFGIGKDTKWFIGMDYSYGSAGGYENKLFNLEKVEYKNLQQLIKILFFVKIIVVKIAKISIITKI